MGTGNWHWELTLGRGTGTGTGNGSGNGNWELVLGMETGSGHRGQALGRALGLDFGTAKSCKQDEEGLAALVPAAL